MAKANCRMYWSGSSLLVVKTWGVGGSEESPIGHQVELLCSSGGGECASTQRGMQSSRQAANGLETSSGGKHRRAEEVLRLTRMEAPAKFSSQVMMARLCTSLGAGKAGSAQRGGCGKRWAFRHGRCCRAPRIIRLLDNATHHAAKCEGESKASRGRSEMAPYCPRFTSTVCGVMGGARGPLTAS